jgi:hypothetical protein
MDGDEKCKKFNRKERKGFNAEDAMKLVKE